MKFMEVKFSIACPVGRLYVPDRRRLEWAGKQGN